MNTGKEEIEFSKTHLEEFNKTGNKVTIPILEEEVSVTKKVIETARVNLSKTINESIESYEIPLSEEEIVVKRIPKNQLVDTMPAASRYEGDVMIIPVLKEVAVIEKRIMLIEEIHVSKLKTEKKESHDVVIRKEEVNITRTKL
jgi:uncharacterized protein (TIGR02271 family)